MAIPLRCPRISQQLLLRRIALVNAMRKLKEELEEIDSELADNLRSGAEIEPGVHIAELNIKINKGLRKEKLRVR